MPSEPTLESTDGPARRTAQAWLEAAREAERRGELLVAVDLAEQGLGEHPDSVALRHGAVLALARSGSTEEAARRFAEYGLDREAEEDIAALAARITKDRALASHGSERVLRAREACGGA